MVLRAGMTEGLQETGLVTWPPLGGDSTVFGSATPVSLFHLGHRKTRQSLEQLGGRLSLVAWPSPRPGRSGLADDAVDALLGPVHSSAPLEALRAVCPDRDAASMRLSLQRLQTPSFCRCASIPPNSLLTLHTNSIPTGN